MNSQMFDLGCKIKKLSGELAEYLDTPGVGGKYSILYHHLDDPHYMQKYLYYLLGHYLSTRDPIIKNDLISFANLLGQRSAGIAGSLDSCISLVYNSRAAIISLMEKEIREEQLGASQLIEAVKLLDPLLNVVLSSVISHYNDILFATKFALDESAEDLRVTMKELAELKRALNEATIFSVMDEQDRYIYINDRFIEVSKYKKEELLGKTPFVLNSGYHPKSYFENVWKNLSEGKIWNGEILNKAKDGSTYWTDTTIIPFVDRRGKRYKHICIQYDITEKKRTEETLQKAEKLSMVGELAAGFAHEIRNPLTTIKGFVQLLDESSKETGFTKTILEEIDRINSIVSDFMIFARPRAAAFTKCDLVEIVRNAARFIEPEALLRNVLILSDYPEEQAFISCEKNQLKQVFLNILKNAIEAIPHGGFVYMSLSVQETEIAVTIKDTGIGMTEEQLKKLGEPFFTTKSTGNGLGLMVTYKIIQDHNGRIDVYSDGPMTGTTFRLTFPKYHEQSQA